MEVVAECVEVVSGLIPEIVHKVHVTDQLKEQSNVTLKNALVRNTALS